MSILFFSKRSKEVDELIIKLREQMAELESLKLEMLCMKENCKAEFEDQKDKLDLAYRLHEETITEYKQQLELQKIYCYIVTKLINHTGLVVPENFDITDFPQAYSLYTKFKNGTENYE